MSFDHVGYENLPNVYIKEMILTKKGQNYFNLTTSWVIKDFNSIGDSYHWITDKILSK